MAEELEKAKKRENIILKFACDPNKVHEFPTEDFLTETYMDERIVVVRDDILCGGTKSRILEDYFLKDVEKYKYFKKYVYISSWYGGAQVALALAVKIVNKKSTFKEREAVIIIPTVPFGVDRGAQIAAAQSLGAKYIETEEGNVYNKAHEYLEEHRTNSFMIPNGFRTPDNIERLAAKMGKIRERFGQFEEAWCAVGSGALIKSMQMANLAEKYYGVCVFGKCPEKIGFVTTIKESLEFSDLPAQKDLPPFPSALRYDAKVWKHVRERKAKKILFWNVLA